MSVFLVCFLLAIPASPDALTGRCPVAHEAIPILQSDEHRRGDKSLDPSAQVVCSAPGDTVGQTTYDWWTCGPPRTTVVLSYPCGPHVVWTGSAQPDPWPEKRTMYNGYDPGSGIWIFGTGMSGGTDVFCTYRNVCGSVDAKSTSQPFVSFQTEIPPDYLASIASDIAPCLGAFTTAYCSSATPDTFAWPTASLDSDDVVHVFARSHSTPAKLEHTYAPDAMPYSGWTELDTLGFGWHNSTASKRSSTVAALYSVCGDSSWQPPDRNNSLVILESFDSGENFTRSTVLKDLLDASDSLDCMCWSGSGVYDKKDSIHVVAVAAKPAAPGRYDPLSACNLWHYTPEHGLHLISSYPWMYELPAFNGTDGVYGNNQLIHVPSTGADTATGYLYVLWNEFPWYEEQGGFQCGELYVSRSTDDGETWSFKMDMTNTRNESEVFPSLAQAVDGNLHILYESDLVAGAYVLGNSGLSYNPVRYLRYPLADGNAAALTIDSPPETLVFDEIYVPLVTVENRSGHPISFSVTCQADYGDYCFYRDTKPVEDLAPGVPTQIAFEPWTPDSAVLGLPGTFWACAGYVGDTDYSDDCVEKPVLVGVEEAVAAGRRNRQFALGQSYPNPFSRSAEIGFTIARSGPVLLAVHDLAGRTVSILVDSDLDSGTYTAVWDGKDSGGNKVASGVYLYSLHAESFADTRKMILFR